MACNQPWRERKENARLRREGGREEVTRGRSSVRGCERREGGRESDGGEGARVGGVTFSSSGGEAHAHYERGFPLLHARRQL